jgi:hypothetical protein
MQDPPVTIDNTLGIALIGNVFTAMSVFPSVKEREQKITNSMDAACLVSLQVKLIRTGTNGRMIPAYFDGRCVRSIFSFKLLEIKCTTLQVIFLWYANPSSRTVFRFNPAQGRWMFTSRVNYARNVPPSNFEIWGSVFLFGSFLVRGFLPTS